MDVFDASKLEALQAKSDRLATMFTESFLGEGADFIANCEAGQESGALDSVKFHAHRMASTALMIGAVPLGESLRQLESNPGDAAFMATVRELYDASAAAVRTHLGSDD